MGPESVVAHECGRLWAPGAACGRLGTAVGGWGRLGLYINLQISVGPGLGPGRE